MLGYKEKVGLLLLQLYPNGGATDIVFVTLFCIAVGTVILRGAVPGSLPEHFVVLAALVFRVGACFEASLFYPRFPHVPVPNRPSRLRGR